MRAFGEFPQHVEFVYKIKEAQEKANQSKEKVPFSWRGYNSCVFPGLPKFQVKDLKERLRLALKGVFNITRMEREV